MRVLHLTDFHLNKKNLRDWNDYVKAALISKLNEAQTYTKFDIVACTGDLIDKGGKDFDSIESAFSQFEKQVANPICEALDLPKSNFLITPGNHDIDRDLDSEPIEIGFRTMFQNVDKLSDYMSKSLRDNDFEGMYRMKPFKEFEREFYNDQSNKDLNVYGSYHKIEIDGKKVGVCCLNNSWRCYDKQDKGRLLIGEQQLIKGTNYIGDCDFKLALLHHPLDSLSEIERDLITKHIQKDFDGILLGHSHKTITTTQIGLNDSLFTHLAPSGLNDIRSDSRSFANGVSIIDFDFITNNSIEVEYLAYVHEKKEFVLNTVEGEGSTGKAFFTFPKGKTLNTVIPIVEEAINNIKQDHFITLDSHLVGVRAEANELNIKEGFVFPPISDGSENKTEDNILSGKHLITLSQIINSSSNYFFFGGRESGRTALLFRLIREYIDKHNNIGLIPVYIDFDEIGNKEIETCIKEYLGISSSKVKKILEADKIILLLDNLSYNRLSTNEYVITKVHNFHEKYDHIRIIGSGENHITGIVPDNHAQNCRIPFKNYFIKNLGTNEIKSLMTKWMPNKDLNDIERYKRVDKMVSSFESYVLPSTPMSVSLFLWSTEHSDREPINNSVLLEIYVDIILEKLSQENIYRKSFDFTNKLQLLANIAEEMLSKNEPNYSILYSEYLNVVENYIEKVGFDFDSNKIAEYLVDRRLFTKYQGNRIKFSFSCFFHFFLAKRMEFNEEFKDHVMSETEYYKFPKEIDYYTGLKRSDKVVFETILERFENAFLETDYVLEIDNIDRYFTPERDDETENKPIVEDVEINHITENRPSEKMLDNFQDIRLQKIKNPDTIIKKEGRNSLERLLIIMSNVLRNSEGVEDVALKERAYRAIVKYSMAYMILHKEQIIKYVIENKRLPMSFPVEIDLINYLVDIPLFVQLGMQKHLGSAKLRSIIHTKIIEDEANKKKISDIEGFLSVALYSDLNGKNFAKHLKAFIKRVKVSKGEFVVSNYLLYKLTYYFYHRTRPGSENEKLYLDLLGELKLRTESLPKAMKTRIMNSIKDTRRKFLGT